MRERFDFLEQDDFGQVCAADQILIASDTNQIVLFTTLIIKEAAIVDCGQGWFRVGRVGAENSQAVVGCVKL